LFSSPLRPPPLPSLFPYTTLFRSRSLDHVLTMSATLTATDPSAGAAPTDQYPQPAVIPTFEEARQRAAELPAHLRGAVDQAATRSEEHTSELQSRFDLVCRLLLEK